MDCVIFLRWLFAVHGSFHRRNCLTKPFTAVVLRALVKRAKNHAYVICRDWMSHGPTAKKTPGRIRALALWLMRSG
jgi:hypothetical protein